MSSASSGEKDTTEKELAADVEQLTAVSPAASLPSTPSSAKRRPTFRPKTSSRKSGTGVSVGDSTPKNADVALLTTTPTSTPTEKTDANVSNASQSTPLSPDGSSALGQEEEPNDEKVETPATSASSKQKRTTPSSVSSPSKRARKRKAVAVGSSRPSLESPPPASTPPNAGASPLNDVDPKPSRPQRHQPSPTRSPLPPPPPPTQPQQQQAFAAGGGQTSQKEAPTLSSFCGKFRAPRKKATAATAAASAALPSVEQDGGSRDTNHKEPSLHTGPVVQVVNGEIVLQESSMVVQGYNANHDSTQPNGGNNPAAQDALLPVIEEEACVAVVGASYHSFVSRQNGGKGGPHHWSLEETQLFYEALRQVGTDFGTMESYFSHRTRRQLKRKFQVESTKNPKLIERVLDPSARKEIDLAVFDLSKQAVEETVAASRAAAKTAAEAAAAREKHEAAEAAKRAEQQQEEQEEIVVAEQGDDNAAGMHDSLLQDSLWPEQKGEEEPATEALDPLLDDESGVAREQEEEAVFLLPTAAASNSAKKKKPKFRSRKKKAK